MSLITAKAGASARPASLAVPQPSRALRVAAAALDRRPADRAAILYRRGKGVGAYVRAIAAATPTQVMVIERQGVLALFIKDLARSMGVASSRMFSILGVPKATAEKKAAAGEWVAGSAGQAAVGMIKLLAMAQDIVDNSLAEEAKNFDPAKWLGQWIERPQPALGGRKPADLIGTPTGVEVVGRLLGALESGAYQ